MSKHTTKITQVPIEMKGNLNCSQILHGETFLDFK